MRSSRSFIPDLVFGVLLSAGLLATCAPEPRERREPALTEAPASQLVVLAPRDLDMQVLRYAARDDVMSDIDAVSPGATIIAVQPSFDLVADTDAPAVPPAPVTPLPAALPLPVDTDPPPVADTDVPHDTDAPNPPFGSGHDGHTIGKELQEQEHRVDNMSGDIDQILNALRAKKGLPPLPPLPDATVTPPKAPINTPDPTNPTEE